MTATTHSSASASFVDPLDRGNIEAIVQGRHGAAFEVLGQRMLRLGDRSVWNVRAWQPGAEEVWVVPGKMAPDGVTAAALPDNALPMRLLDPAGLFSLLQPDAAIQPYYLAVRRHGALSLVPDPYAFPPLLSEYDLYLMGEGTHRDAYERLGAHPRQLEGVSGVGFAVWAPNARRVSVVGDFNGWDERANPMRMRPNGVWELFLPGVSIGALYKYAILSWNQNYRVLKSDPFAFWAEVRPGTASRVWDLGGYQWGDERWLRERERRNGLDQPISIYEVHPGSWRPNSAPGSGQVTYRDLAHQLVPYVKEMGYTHIELMPVAEHPYDGSWGYQVTGYYAPTSRYGTPQDFMYLVDQCHQQGIGVLVDWVPAHFPRDEHGLRYFDGTHLYEHADPRKGEHPEWGTVIPNFGRNEVRNFFVSNALFWLDKYHIDGLRVDAVASLIYLDYGRKPGEWEPNAYGGRENLEAVSFIQECNSVVHERFPHALTIAEESTAWPKVTAPPAEGGLGFSLKWNMGWMHDILDYIKRDPIYRSHHQNEMTFSFTYAYSEKYVLPLSHDEVVHVKGSMLNKMPGDRWQRFANLRALYAFMYGHPGKKLLFMGGEFGQWSEWNFAGYLDWYVLDPQGPDGPLHEQLRTLVRDLNRLYATEPALHEGDVNPEGFEWIDGTDAAHSTIFWVRYNAGKSDAIVVACNFTPVPHYGYRVGVPGPGRYEEILNTDAEVYGGSNVGNLGGVLAEAQPMHYRSHSIALTLPPLGVVFLRRAADAADGERAGTSSNDDPIATVTEQPARKRATARKNAPEGDGPAPNVES
jgi:1,4-alpha-glucan branching enzyme